MKSIKLVSPGRFETVEDELPQCRKDNYALIKIASVGICGSDMHYFVKGKIGEQVVDYPFTIGHEASGYIEKLMTESSRFKEGDLVAIDPALPCHQCDQCKMGREHTCRNLLFMGAPGQHEGLMKEYVWVPTDNLFKLSEDYSPQEAAFIEPFAIGVYAVKLADIRLGEKCAVLGVGPIGLSVLMSLLQKGMKTIIATDILNYRLNFASKIGAAQVYDAHDDKLYNNIKEEVDVVFECAGEQDALNFAVDILKPGGRLIIIGIPSEDKVYFDISKFRRKELKIINVRRQNNCMEDAIEIFNSFKQFSKDIITHHFSINDINKAFNLVRHYDDNVIKAVINFE